MGLTTNLTKAKNKGDRMNIIELKDPKILGEEHPQYGYAVWSETDGDYPVMFNTKNGNIMPGTRVSYESSELKTSAKGNEYLRLKKVQFEDSASKPDIPFQAKPAPSFKPEPTFEKAAKVQSDKDSQITKNMVWKNLLQLYDVPTMLIDTTQWEEFWANVELHTEMLIVGNIDRLKPRSLGNEFRARKVTEEFGEPPEDV